MQSLKAVNPSIYDRLSNFFSCPRFSCHPLMGRITSQWKETLIDCSAVVAIGCFALSFFAGSTLLCATFFLMALSLCTAAYQMRKFSQFKTLENTTKELQKTNDQMKSVANDLKKENDRLVETNRQLTQNNTVFQQNNIRLAQTNTQLQQQVTLLSLQVTQLRESAQQIRSEIIEFRRANSTLNLHVTGFDASLRMLDQQLLNSRALCDQIANHLENQQLGIREQLSQLGTYLQELRADNTVLQKIEQLAALQQQMTIATQNLHDVQLQYATERANFQAIHQAMLQLKTHFDQAIRDAANTFHSNNVQFKENVANLAQERQKLNDLIQRHFG